MSLKSWGLEIWDQIDKVFLYCNQGIDQSDLYCKTFLEIHKIYVSLAKKHKSLVQSPAKTKLLLENGSYMNSFNCFMSCMTEQAAIYEKQAEEIRTQVFAPIKAAVDEMKVTVSNQTKEYYKFKTNLENQKKFLDTAWSKYYTAHVARKKADAAYHKIKDDKTIPRLDIEKVQAIAQAKQQEFERMRGEYAVCLQQFNSARCNLYLKDLVKICSELEMADRKKAEATMEAGLALVRINEMHLKDTNQCNGRVGDAISLIDYKADAIGLIAACRTELIVPPAIIFVDLEKSNRDTFHASDFPGISQQGGKIEKNDVPKSLFGGTGMRGIEVKDMLPEQMKVHLDNLSETNRGIEKQLAGLNTLHDTYRKDPSMGNATSLLPDIDVNERQLESLRAMTDEMNRQYQRVSIGGVSTDSSGAVAPGSRPPPPRRTYTSETGTDDDDDFDEDEDDEADPQPAKDGDNRKLAKVLYSFDATDEQQLSIHSDMKLKVVNYDDGGSGWTLVQHADDAARRGYVPTNYIQLL